MAIEKQSSSYLEVSRVTLENIEKNEEVKGLLAAKSYDEVRLQDGKTRFDTVTATIQLYFARNEQTLSKRIESDLAMKDAQFMYSNITMRLRSFYRASPETVSALGISGRRENNPAKFMVQAGSFYDKVMNTPELLAISETGGVSTAELTEGLGHLNSYMTLRTQYVSFKGSLQKLKVQRKLELNYFKAWMTPLRYTLRIIFKNNPQTLEELGIFVRNSKIKKKKTTEPAAPTDPGEPADPAEPTDPGTPTDPTDPTTPTTPPAQKEKAAAGTAGKKPGKQRSKKRKRRNR